MSFMSENKLNLYSDLESDELLKIKKSPVGIL